MSTRYTLLRKQTTLATMALALLMTGCAGMSSGEKQAVVGQSADVLTTAGGLAMGAAELNPLGPLGGVAVKAVAYGVIRSSPPSQQPEAWRLLSSFGYGAAANNMCWMLVTATGGTTAPWCLLTGTAVGYGYYALNPISAHEMFDSICAEQRLSNPDLVCTYTP